MDSLPVIDDSLLSELKDIMGSEFITLINAFVADARQRLSLMAEAIQDDDQERLRTTAHSFKGSSANLGANKLKALCETMETTLAVEATPLLSDIESALHEVEVAFRERGFLE